MQPHLLFVTGSLAEESLHQVMTGIAGNSFSWEIRNIGVKVAALLTTDIIRNRLGHIDNVTRVILPGRCRADLQQLEALFGIPFEQGPDELRDLPQHLGETGTPVDLSQHKVRIFTEIVDAPNLNIEQILQRAAQLYAKGGDVIDLGCLPDTPFPHLTETVKALKQQGYKVSVDSLEAQDLLKGGRAGADYLLSLTEETLWVADEVAATPVLIPAPDGDMTTLYRAYEQLREKNHPCLLDPILDPIHFGFTDSISRYRDLRRRYPAAEILMGTGNLTELTEADTLGINTLLMGIVSELDISNVLTTQVSPHCRTVIRELDHARRVMFRAKAEQSLPKQISAELTALHERQPHPYSVQEIEQAATQVKDPNYRIQVSQQGIHIYNRNLYHTASDPFDIYPRLELKNDCGHAFYLGVELARAEIAHQLGKRYTQDQPLQWGCTNPTETSHTATASRRHRSASG